MSALPSRTPGRPRDEHVDAAILKATTELVADNGFGALTMEAVSSRSGVAKSSIYRRWSNKDDLIFDALADLKGPVPTPPGESVRGDLVFMIVAMRGQWTDGLHGRLMRQLSVDGSDARDHYRRFRDRLIAPRQVVLKSILARGVQEGIIDPSANHDWVLQLLVAPIIAAGLTHQDRISSKHIEFNVDVILCGIAPR
ncbi:MAG: TetR family transcriptional regulator [Pseudonocardiales bacterium]|nr:TetR family transcriptional regulator [Pseudonocardiales bacterium]